MLSKRSKYYQFGAAALTLLLWAAPAEAAHGASVVTIGANLTSQERNAMLRDFGVQGPSVRVILIHHADEERLLSGVAPQSEIGTRSISSSAVTTEDPGYGIRVSTRDITWVTPAMYANALATAGIKNAKVMADAPFPVSGTAALAGILTAYQAASGAHIPLGQQRTAAKEMIVTGNIGDQIGNKKTASALMMQIKNVVIARRLTDPATIRPIVIQEANRLSISLTNSQITQITNLMVSISHLSLDATTLTAQLRTWAQTAQSITPPGFWQKVGLWFHQIWLAISSIAKPSA